MKARFLRDILPKLANFEVTEAELNEADEKAKAAAIAATGRAWSEVKPYTDAEDDALLLYIDSKGLQSKTGSKKLWRKM